MLAVHHLLLHVTVFKAYLVNHQLGLNYSDLLITRLWQLVRLLFPFLFAREPFTWSFYFFLILLSLHCQS